MAEEKTEITESDVENGLWAHGNLDGTAEEKTETTESAVENGLWAHGNLEGTVIEGIPVESSALPEVRASRPPPGRGWVSSAGVPIPTSVTSHAAEPELQTGLQTPPRRGFIRSAGIPIPSAMKAGDSSYGPSRHESLKTTFTVPNSWRTVQTPSSWGGSSYLLNDDASLYDEQSDRGTDAGSAAGLSYARKRRLLRRLSKTSLKSPGSRRPTLHFLREKWTKKLEDYREYEVGILKSLLPLKAGVGAALAACFCFAPFVPESLRSYGAVIVLGVGTCLDANVGLTLQKGSNLLLGSAFAGACALLVSLLEPFTGPFSPYFLIACAFLGGCLPRLIALPAVVKTRFAQTFTFCISVFHGLILDPGLRMNHPQQFFLNCLFYSAGFVIVLLMTFGVRSDYAGDSLLALLVSDFHTAGVVLERIVEDYKSGNVLTKIQELLSGVVIEDHIHHDLQYIIKSTEEAEQLMNAIRWEPSHGKFFRGYPWDLYPTLMAMLIHVMYDLIALDSALRAEIQAPLDVRLFFAEDMEILAKECSMLFHKVGDALFEHKKIDYYSNVERVTIASFSLKRKLSKHSQSVIAQDMTPYSPSGEISRTTSCGSILGCDEQQLQSGVTTPPTSPTNAGRLIEQDLETAEKLTMDEEDWRARFFSTRQSVSAHWDETQQQISSLSFIKFASILIEFMGRVKMVVTMVDQISIQARFNEVT